MVDRDGSLVLTNTQKLSTIGFNVHSQTRANLHVACNFVILRPLRTVVYDL
jgi:hypothetical protein